MCKQNKHNSSNVKCVIIKSAATNEWNFLLKYKFKSVRFITVNLYYYYTLFLNILARNKFFKFSRTNQNASAKCLVLLRYSYFCVLLVTFTIKIGELCVQYRWMNARWCESLHCTASSLDMWEPLKCSVVQSFIVIHVDCNKWSLPPLYRDARYAVLFDKSSEFKLLSHNSVSFMPK